MLRITLDASEQFHLKGWMNKETRWNKNSIIMGSKKNPFSIPTPINQPQLNHQPTIPFVFGSRFSPKKEQEISLQPSTSILPLKTRNRSHPKNRKNPWVPFAHLDEGWGQVQIRSHVICLALRRPGAVHPKSLGTIWSKETHLLGREYPWFHWWPFVFRILKFLVASKLKGTCAVYDEI